MRKVQLTAASLLSGLSEAVDGSYKISGIPPGQYTVVAWHEKLGEQTLDLFLAGSEQRNLDFTFKAADH